MNGKRCSGFVWMFLVCLENLGYGGGWFGLGGSVEQFLLLWTV